MHLLKETCGGGWVAVQQPGFSSSYTKQDTDNKEMEKTEGHLHLLLRVEKTDREQQHR